MHPRLSVLSRFFDTATPFAAELAQLAAGGARRVGLYGPRLTQIVVDPQAPAAAGVEITHVAIAGLLPLDSPACLAGARERVRGLIDTAAGLGAARVYGPTGGAPGLEWEAAADAFVREIEPVARHARDRGVALLLEPTSPLRADLSILHTLADTAEVARRSGVGVCLDVQHCWRERHLRAAIRDAVPIAGLVQISDWVPGRQDGFRAVPGDGAIPLDRVLGWVLEAGYDGLIDLEVSPEPGVPATETVARAVDAGGALLERLGV